MSQLPRCMKERSKLSIPFHIATNFDANVKSELRKVVAQQQFWGVEHPIASIAHLSSPRKPGASAYLVFLGKPFFEYLLS